MPEESVYPRMGKYHLAVVLVAAASLWLAYGPLESELWRESFALVPFGGEGGGGTRDVGWLYEFLRVVGIALLAFVGYAKLGEEGRAPWRRDEEGGVLVPWLSRLSATERWTTVSVVGGVVAYHVVAAWLLFDEASAAGGASGGFLPEALLPYLAYLPYSIVVYVLLVLPLLFAVRRRVVADREALGVLRSEIGAAGERASTGPVAELEAAGQRLRNVFNDFRVRLREISNSYLWLFMLLVLYFLGELESPVQETLSTPALDAMKTCVWLLVLGGVGLVAWMLVLYAGEARRTLAAFEEMRADRELDAALDAELQRHRDWCADHQVPAFAMSFRKMGGPYGLTAPVILWVVGHYAGKGVVCGVVDAVLPTFVQDAAVAVVELVSSTTHAC